MKLLIIDDETSARDIIKMMCDFPAFGFEQILEAGNGKAALDLIDTYKPELILTDMKMPEMDGVSLLNRLEGMQGNFRVVVISGYADYEYTRVAIKTKVVDYILKPIKKAELMAAIGKALRECHEHASAHHGEANAPLPRDPVQEILLGARKKDITRADMDQYLGDIGYLDEHAAFCLVLIKIINFDRIRKTVFSGYAELMLYSMEEAVTGFFSELDGAVHTLPFDKSNEFLVMIRSHRNDAGETKGRLAETAECLIGVLEGKFSLQCIAAFREEPVRKPHIHAAVKRMSQTLYQYNLLSGSGTVRCTKNMSYDELGKYSFADHSKELASALRNGDGKSMKGIISEIFDEIRRARVVCAGDLDLLCIELLRIAQNTLETYNLDVANVLRAKSELDDFQNHSGDMEGVREWMLSFADACIAGLSIARKDACSKVLQDILKYVDTYYYEKIDLELLSEKFYLSPGYISRLFKKELDENFIVYLNRIRMDKAAEMLRDSDSKLLNVSEMAGYADVSYFSRSFKKKFGVAPEEYRSNAEVQKSHVKSKNLHVSEPSKEVQ